MTPSKRKKRQNGKLLSEYFAIHKEYAQCYHFSISFCSVSSNSTDGFTEWGPWSQCSRTCGSNLLRVRKRSCFKQNIQSCAGSTSEVKPCMLPSCPGDTIPGFRTEAGLSGTVSHNSEFIS